MKAQLKIVFYIIVILISLVVLKLLSEIIYQIYKTDEPIWQMVWSDEFDNSGSPDSDVWDYELGDGCPALCGWGNRELQHYTDKPENVRVEDGNLIIQVQYDTAYTNNYTSAKLRTKPEYSVKYGKVEVRAKNPSGRGIWPAIWMLPTHKKYGGWPKSGEIDIMEHVGYSADSIFGTVHTEAYNHLKGTYQYDAMAISDNEDAFHNYVIVWSPSKIDFFIDDNLYFTFENENKTSKEWPFDQEFYLIINSAVGGNWGGKFGIDEIIAGQKFLIDYVRVYEDKSPKSLF